MSAGGAHTREAAKFASKASVRAGIRSTEEPDSGPCRRRRDTAPLGYANASRWREGERATWQPCSRAMPLGQLCSVTRSMITAGRTCSLAPTYLVDAFYDYSTTAEANMKCVLVSAGIPMQTQLPRRKFSRGLLTWSVELTGGKLRASA